MSSPDVENHASFENRKADHIRLSLLDRMQATGGSGFDRIHLEHEALPDLDFADVQIATKLFGREIASPLFISSMTAGHEGSRHLNLVMARAAGQRGWAMGVGSQRRQLTDSQAAAEWSDVRRACPHTRFFGNIGIAQLVRSEISEIRRLADSLAAEAMIVHLNPLQECMQPEGTPQFKGGLRAIENLVRQLGIPVIVKETGCGFSVRTLKRLGGIGIAAVDVGGFGGTHWGRIEGGRASAETPQAQAAETFRDWGIATVDSLLDAVTVKSDYRVWASGGVRSGLDAAKALAMGAEFVGFAKPIIEVALEGEDALARKMEAFEYELKTALFCTGARNMAELQEKKLWRAESKT